MNRIRAIDRALLVALVCHAAAPLVGNVLPILTTILSDKLHFTAGIIGAFATADLVGSACGPALAIPLMRSASPRTTVGLGLVILLCADLGSTLAAVPNTVIGLRALGGIGTGLVSAACTYVYSLKSPERNTAASVLAVTGMSAIAMVSIPVVVSMLGWQALFGFLAACLIPGLTFLRYLPSTYASPTADDIRLSNTVRRSLPLLASASAIAAIALQSLGLSALWTYLGEVGNSLGIAAPDIASSLSTAALCGFVGSALVVMLNRWLARHRSSGTAVALLAMFIALSGLRSGSAPTFAVCVTVFYFFIPVYTALTFGLFTSYAADKRFAVKISGSYTIAFSVGPAVGALLIQSYGFASLQAFSAVLTGLAGAAVWFFCKQVKHERID